MAATTVGFFWHPPVRPGVILFPVWSADIERQLHQVSSLHPQHIDFLAEFGVARGLRPDGRDSSRIDRIFEMLRTLRLRSSTSRTRLPARIFPEFRQRGDHVL